MLLAGLFGAWAAGSASRQVGLSSGDRWLRPTLNCTGVIMDDPAASPDWVLHSSGALTLQGGATTLCIVASPEAVGSVLALGEASAGGCLVLEGHALRAPSVQGLLCADPQGLEHEVRLAECSPASEAFRAVD